MKLNWNLITNLWVKIIVKIPLNINEELNVENLEELEEKIGYLKIKKRLAFKNRLKIT